MSECDCGQVEIPLGLPMCNLNGTLHGVTACVDKDRWEERALEAEAAIARVRELCDNKQREVEESDPLFGPPLTLTVPDVLRALDGDGDE